MFGHGLLVAPQDRASNHSRALSALVIVSSVVNVLEETMKSVSAGSRSQGRFGKIDAIHIGNEPEGHGALAVMLEEPHTP